MAKKHLSDFVEFLRKQSVVGLAVGLAIGTQVTETTRTLVDGFVNPVVNFLLSFIMHNPQDLEKLQWQVAGEPHLLVVKWGLILSFLLKLIAVAAVIYFVVTGLRLDRLDKKDEE
ncbi:MscL family protein [Candidatus Saccharibacteria bacterium]|nr:MscL family protein [Candidatus Saccharibacteria bacterium]